MGSSAAHAAAAGSSANVGLRAELDSFVRAVSHDLRAPLRHITAYGKLLQEQLGTGGDPKAAGDYAAVMVQSAQHMGLLVDGLVEWARLGQVVPQRMAFDMGTLVAEARAGMRADAGGRLVRWKVASDLPRLQGDPALLRQLWRHLLSNALKFTARCAQTEVTVSWEPLPGEGAVAFFVSDNGAGFGPAQAGQLFHPFQRLHSTKQFPGIGMGLALSRRIVECHGGHIGAEAVPDGGCTVRFTLPA